MELEINKELVLSTSHLKKSTLEKFFTECFVKENDFSADENNVRFHVEICLNWNNDCREGSEVDFPSELLNLLKLAESHGCKWLVLDCDGDQVEGLPTFGW